MFKRGSKYKNKRTKVDGLLFDSKLESNHYLQLKESGLIFERQKKFVLLDSFKFAGMSIREIA